MIILKKYSNRKIYNTKESRYVNLSEIEQLIKQGEKVTIIENSSGRNITGEVLLQVISNNTANSKNLGVIVSLIRENSLQ